jgi:MarR family transcriptional regulator, organic hydroperoxide resistance regulator
MAKTEDLLHCCLYFTANSLSRIISRLADECFATSGQAPSYCFLLMLAAEQSGITQKELAEKMHLAPSTVTRFVETLEKKGLVRREMDGKVSRVMVMEAGQVILESIQASWKLLYQRYSDVLGEEEGASLTRLIDEACRKLEE